MRKLVTQLVAMGVNLAGSHFALASCPCLFHPQLVLVTMVAAMAGDTTCEGIPTMVTHSGTAMVWGDLWRMNSSFSLQARLDSILPI